MFGFLIICRMHENLKVTHKGLEGNFRWCGRYSGCLESGKKVYRVSGRCLKDVLNNLVKIT